MKIVSVAVLLAALALIILIGPGATAFEKITEAIGDGTLTTNDGSYPMYAYVYYTDMGAVYGLLYSCVLYSCVTAVAGIFIRMKGTYALAVTGCVSGVLLGTFMLLSDAFEGNAAFNEMLCRLSLGEKVNFNAETDAIYALPGKMLVFAVIIIIVSVALAVILRLSALSRVKGYRASGILNLLLIYTLLVLASVYFDIVRNVVLDKVFAHNQISEQTYGILTDYYLNDALFVNQHKVYAVIIAFVLTVVLVRVGVKRKFIKMLVSAPFVIAGIISVVAFLFNTPRLFGYITIDEAVCDRVELVGILALLVLVTDIVIIAVVTAAAFENPKGTKAAADYRTAAGNKEFAGNRGAVDMNTTIAQNEATGRRAQINARLIVVALVYMLISIVAIFSGLVLPIAAVYAVMLVVNLICVFVLNKI